MFGGHGCVCHRSRVSAGCGVVQAQLVLRKSLKKKGDIIVTKMVTTRTTKVQTVTVYLLLNRSLFSMVRVASEFRFCGAIKVAYRLTFSERKTSV